MYIIVICSYNAAKYDNSRKQPSNLSAFTYIIAFVKV